MPLIAARKGTGSVTLQSGKEPGSGGDRVLSGENIWRKHLLWGPISLFLPFGMILVEMTTESKSQLGLKEQNLFMTRGTLIKIWSHTILLNKCCILEEIFISKA